MYGFLTQTHGKLELLGWHQADRGGKRGSDSHLEQFRAHLDTGCGAQLGLDWRGLFSG